MLDNKNKKVYHQVIDYISKEIDEGKLGKGDKIPTERKLVEVLGIGRNSIREALKILDIIGLVERRQGDGTYIKEEFDNWFSEPMSIAFMLSDSSKNEIFEFRNMIEVEIATLAAKRITDDEIYELKNCLLKLIDINNETEKVKYDKKFHSLIAKASKNLIIINSYNAMSYMLDLFIYDIRTIIFDTEGDAVSKKLHKDIFDAIASRNSKDAREAMKRHMDIIKRYFK